MRRNALLQISSACACRWWHLFDGAALRERCYAPAGCKLNCRSLAGSALVDPGCRFLRPKMISMTLTFRLADIWRASVDTGPTRSAASMLVCLPNFHPTQRDGIIIQHMPDEPHQVLAQRWSLVFRTKFCADAAPVPAVSACQLQPAYALLRRRIRAVDAALQR